MKPLFRLPIALIVSLLAAPAAFAGPTSIRGTVVDDSGAPLPGVVVVITAGSGNPREVTSDGTGAFMLHDVPDGTVHVHAELAGFQPVDLNATVDANGENVLSVTMKIGFAQEVTVTADVNGGVLAPTRNADLVEFDSETLRRLPSDAQDVQAIVDIFAAAAPAGGATLVVDGVETDGAAIPAVAIHRAAINRSPYDAEFRGPGRARVEIETDRGSRRFYHGSGAMFFRNGALQARNAFATTDPHTSRGLSEGTIGGPLPKRKWSFFASGQRFIDGDVAVVNALTLNGTVVANTPTADRRVSAFGRIDFRPNDTDDLRLGYDLLDAAQSNRGVGGLRLAETAYGTTQRRHRVQMSDRRATAAARLNDFRLEFSSTDAREGAPATEPSIIVSGAFTGGPSPTDTDTASTSVQVQDTLTMIVAAHTVRVGARVKPRWMSATDRSNFGGTFQFRSLADFAANRPMLLIQRVGSATASFVDADTAGFVETEFRPTSSLAITTGLRYDWQTEIADRNNIAPRIAAAFAPADRHFVIRGGFGRFFQLVPQHVLARTRLFGDGGVRERAVEAPAYPAPLSSSAAFDGPTAVWLLSPSVQMPATTQSSVSVERSLGRNATVSAEYLHMQTSGAVRTLDTNAPNAATSPRPDPARLNVFAVGPFGSGRTDALTVTTRARLRTLRATIQYTLGRSVDDGSTPFALPADSHNLGAEWARADFDRRQRLNVTATYGWFDDHVRLGGVVAASSGAPFDIETGADDNHDLVVNDRPVGVGRNTGDGPTFAQLDLRLTTVLPLPRPPSADPRSLKRERIDNLELNVDLFNVFNRLNAPTYVGIVTSPFFGRPNIARIPRTAQLSVRYRF